MERLLKDAEKLTGKKYDLSSYADIVDAIHAVQTQMGITGTTAAEASDTIQGSLSSTKAAWENLLTAFGSGKKINRSMKAFVKSASNVVKNMLPVIGRALTGIGDFIVEIAPIIEQNLPRLVADLLPALLRAAGSLVTAVVRALPGMLQAVGTSFMSVLDTIKGLDWGAIGQSALTMISGAWSNLKTWASTLWKNAKAGIAGVDWGTVADTVTGAIASGWATLKEWATGLWETAKSGIEAVDWTGVGTWIWGKIKTPFLSIAGWFQQRFAAAPDSIKSIDWAQLGIDVWDAIKGAFETVGSVLSQLFGGARNDIETTIDWSGLGSSIVDTILASFMSLNTFLLNFFTAAWKDIKNINWGGLGDKIHDFIVKGMANIGAKFREKGEEAYDGVAGLDWLKLGADIAAHILYGMVMLPVGIVETVRDGMYAAIGEDDLAEDAGRQMVDAFMSGPGFAQLPENVRQTAIQAMADVSGSTYVQRMAGNAGEKTEGSFVKGMDGLPGDVGGLATDASDIIVTAFGASSDAVYGPFMDAETKAKSAISRIQQAINSLKGKHIQITVDTVAGANAGIDQKITPNARAMSAGRIFNRPTIFGYAEGAYQMAGDAGPEAVVGVNSLDHMIQTSVRQAMGAVVDRLDQLISKQGTQIVLDTGALVGGIASEMNNELGNIYDRRGGRRA